MGIEYCKSCGCEIKPNESRVTFMADGREVHFCSLICRDRAVGRDSAWVLFPACNEADSSFIPPMPPASPKLEALRFNEGKTPYAYLPLDLLDGASRVMEYGGKKYGDPENYRKGYEDLKSPLSSIVRHITALQRAIAEEDKDGSKGDLVDKESGHPHIHHVITSTILLIHSMRLKGWKV